MRNTLFLEENKSLAAMSRAAVGGRHAGFAAAISLYQTAKRGEVNGMRPAASAGLAAPAEERARPDVHRGFAAALIAGRGGTTSIFTR